MKNLSPQRILLVVTKSNFGGAQRYVFEIAKELQLKNYTVAVASGGQTGELIERLHAVGITHLPIKNFARNINFIKEIKAAIELARHIHTFKPTIVHLNSSKAGGTGAVISRLFFVPNIIFTAHGWAHNENRNWLWRTATLTLGWITGLFVHKIITVSEYDRLTSPRFLVQKKCTTINTGISDINWLPKDQSQSHFNIEENQPAIQVVTIAELTANKNILFAIKTIAEFNQTNKAQFHYTIIGDGEGKTGLQSYINKNHITCVSLAGQMTDARRYLKAFDVFLLPSLKEGMPYALLEAAAAGLPLIASDRGGISEIINTSKVGLLIDPTISATLSDALAQMSDLTIRQAFGNQAHTRSMDFTLEKMLTKTLSIYDSKTTSSVRDDSRATD